MTRMDENAGACSFAKSLFNLGRPPLRLGVESVFRVGSSKPPSAPLVIPAGAKRRAGTQPHESESAG